MPRNSPKSYWVYILQCVNGSLYTGYTADLEKRFASHLAGKASKFTRSFKPLHIAQSWEILGKKEAMRLECLIKKLSKIEKLRLIASPEKLFNI